LNQTLCLSEAGLKSLPSGRWKGVEIMGWIYTQKDKDESILEFFQRNFDYKKNDGRYGKVIACAVVKFRTAYLAFECFSPEIGKEVVGVVCKLDYAPNDYYNFGYKDIEESCGPAETECPERILKLLTPTDSEDGIKWREACWQNLKVKKVRLARGKKVRSPEPIFFTNGQSYQIFTVINVKNKIFRTENGDLVKIRGKVNWQDAESNIEPELLCRGGM